MYRFARKNKQTQQNSDKCQNLCKKPYTPDKTQSEHQRSLRLRHVRSREVGKFVEVHVELLHGLLLERHAEYLEKGRNEQ